MKSQKQNVNSDYSDIEITPELRQKIFVSLLEDISSEKESLEQQTKVNLGLLEDVNKARAQLERRFSELNIIDSLIQDLGKSLKTEDVFETFIVALKKMFAKNANFAYLILPSDFGEDPNLIYIHANSTVGNDYIQAIKDNLVSAMGSIQIKAKRKKEMSKWIHGKFKFEFFEGKNDQSDSRQPLSNFNVQLVVRDEILGIINLSSFDGNAFTKEDTDLVNTMIGITANTISRLRQLLESEQSKIQSLVENLSNGVIMFDLDRKVIMSNEAVQKLTGLPSKGFYISEFTKLMETQNEKVEESVAKLLRTGDSIFFDEVGLSRYIYEVVLTPVLDNEKNIVGGAVILHDVTHIKEVDRMKTEFVSVASHQLRTPLTAIKLFVEMLADEEVGKLNSKQKDYMENIDRSTKRMIELVNDLLNVSRIETGRLKIDPKPTQLDEFIQSIIDESAPVLKEHHCSIIFEKLVKKIPLVPIDQTLVHQVFHNLITNAIRYSADGGCGIYVKLDQKDDYYVISVRDNGIGIPKNEQSRIFQKFFRADNAQKKVTEGNGLGLYVAKMIVEASGGKIWFESESGKGTTFYVTLPKEGMKVKKGEKGIIE
jgi:PAS domain S-box-containing protein